ncbi:MAG: ABC transporter substrate binding protein [Thermodesulfovibrionales bacterium]|nr:ABC transporter substrate binding protein [Thermodesulfovibrionales bacterium]
MAIEAGNTVKGIFKGIAIILLCASAFLLASPASAAEKTVGVILSADTPFYKDIHRAFTEELAKRGIKVKMLVQTPSPETVSWINAARKLVAIDVDVIVTYGDPVTAAAISETSSIPVIFAGVFDLDSVGMKGRKNVSGISSKVPLIGIIKIMKDITNFGKLGIVYSSIEKATVRQAEEIEGYGGKLGYAAVKFNVRRLGDADKIRDVDALFITTSCIAQQCTDDVIGAARKQKIPTATAVGGSEESGMVLTISADPAGQGREAAEMLARVIAGESPSAIPVVGQPKKVDMVINLKEATSIGVKVPFDILTSATRVIK